VPRHQEPERLTVRQTIWQLNLDEIKPLLALTGSRPRPGRKGELIDQLASFLETPSEVRALYDGLDDLARKAVQEAAHDQEGVFHPPRFAARHGRSPDFGGPGRWRNEQQPTRLRLFFPRDLVLPTDLRATLLTFVPKPSPLSVAGEDVLPARVHPPHADLGDYFGKPDQEEVELRVRETARAALLDVKAVLRLVDAGEVKVGEKTRRPSQASLKAVAAVLSEGDFYTEDDDTDYSYDPGSDLTIRAFAWPMLLQAAGLTGTTGTKLQLTPAGRKATTRPPHEVIRQAWSKWQKTPLLDEFSRIDAIKGQQSTGSLTAVAPRRQAVVAGLEKCPAGKWIRIEEFFRLLKAEHHFAVARNDWKLYISDPQYGSLGYDSRFAWEGLQGRFAMAFLFEYAATLGLLDVAYLSPVGARNDFGDRWGTDDLSCLSRYDGLMYFRINPLGAWCLGLVSSYEPPAADVEKVLKVLPNLDVVAADRQPSAADVLFLERFAERTSEAVWHLSRDRILVAVEQGLAVGELKEFLTSRVAGTLPQTAAVFLDDLEAKAGLLEDLGAARLVACKDAVVARTLASDRRLRDLCQLAGERCLVFKASDEAAVRRALRELGHVLPPPR
jgi:hypothetical protein